MQMDDERYPIPVHTTDEANLPQLATHTQAAELFEHGREKYSLPSDTPSSLKDRDRTPFSPAADGDGNGRTILGEIGSELPRRQSICGLRRRIFWFMFGTAAALIAVGAIVGGVVGSRKVASSRNPDSTPEPTSTAPPLNPTIPLAASKRAIAAASQAGNYGKNTTLQILYQDLSTINILYRLLWDDVSRAERVASLKIPPNQGTPLAATSMSPSFDGTVTIDVFYLTTGNSTMKPMICQATLECAHGAEECSTKYNEIIGQAAIEATINKGVNADSTLAAILTEDTAEFRVFFQGGGGLVWCLVGHGRPDASSWQLMRINALAVSRSAISASVKRATQEIGLIWTSSDSSKQRETLFKDLIEPAKNPGTDIDIEAKEAWDVGTRQAACYMAGPDIWKAFYVGPSNGEIVGYSRRGNVGGWGMNIPAKWKAAEGGIAAVCWTDQIRLIYMNKGKLTMSAADNGAWDDARQL